MPNTIAEIIKDSSENALGEAVGSPFNSNQSLYDQALTLLKMDEQNFQRLGTNFLIAQELSDSLDVEFNSFLAEPLLREGSLLLDRCLQERKEYQELHAKWFEVCVQVDEMFRLSDITERESTESDELQIQILEAEKTTQQHQSSNAAANAKRLTDTKQGWDAESADLAQAINNGTIAHLMASLLQSGPVNGTWETPNGAQSFDLIREGAKKPAALQRKYDRLRFDIEEAQYLSIEQVANDNVSKLELEKSLQANSIKFKNLRNEVARLMALRRARQMGQKDGALNFLQQMKPIKSRFDTDLVSAYLRLEAAHNGFKKLYGTEYEDRIKGFPGKVGVNEKGFVGKIDFDELVTWSQLTNIWLASFIDKQQLVTRSLSLRQIIGDDEFKVGRVKSEWTFTLTENDLPCVTKKSEGEADQKLYCHFMRLRSFAVQIDSENVSGAWNISITPPLDAKIRQNDGVHELEQSVGTLFLGRVNERTFAVVPEGAAPPRLYNASPIGKWLITVINHSTTGASVNDIHDIDIHLTVALV